MDLSSTNAKIGAVIGSVGAGFVLVFLIVLSVIAVLWSRHICTFQFSLVSKYLSQIPPLDTVK